MKLRKENKKVKKTSFDKEVKVGLKKADFVKMLSDIEKYPMAIRIAAELHRHGVTVEVFERQFELEGNPVSNMVYRHLIDFRHKKGLDPEKVPSLLPVFLRHVSTAQLKEKAEKEKKGRPTAEQAKTFLTKVLNDCLKRGWHQVDFINTLRDMIDSETKPIMSLKSNSDDEEEETVQKAKNVYFARIAGNWRRFERKGDADKAIEADDEAVFGPVDVPKEGEHCYFCNFRLNGTVITLREKSGIQMMHMGCYWMNVARPEQITLGMQVINAADGTFYRWEGPDKGGWRRIEPTLATNETFNTGPDRSQGVSAPSGNESK